MPAHTHDDSLIINREHRTHSEKLLPMSSDRSVTYVPGRTLGFLFSRDTPPSGLFRGLSCHLLAAESNAF
jgi:hypothetical protein